jgi:hypothetical protein
MDRQALYRIRLQGWLDPLWAQEFGDLRIRHMRRAQGSPITTIVGEVRDQAALSGLLSLVYDLGCPLLSVTYLGEEK